MADEVRSRNVELILTDTGKKWVVEIWEMNRLEGKLRPVRLVPSGEWRPVHSVVSTAEEEPTAQAPAPSWADAERALRDVEQFINVRRGVWDELAEAIVDARARVRP